MDNRPDMANNRRVSRATGLMRESRSQPRTERRPSHDSTIRNFACVYPISHNQGHSPGPHVALAFGACGAANLIAGTVGHV